jgi:hypothetical protein
MAHLLRTVADPMPGISHAIAFVKERGMYVMLFLSLSLSLSLSLF